MAVRISNAAARGGLDAITALLNAGTTNPTPRLRILSGTEPATVETAETGTLLAELDLSVDAFQDAVDATGSAQSTGNAVTQDASADATGTAGYCRLVDRDGTAVLQGDVSTSGAFLNMVTTSIVSGQPVDVSSMTLSLPEA